MKGLNVETAPGIDDLHATPFSSHISELGEGPTWRDSEQALYWIDVMARSLHCRVLGESSEMSWKLPGLPASFAFRERGGVLMAFRNRIAITDSVDGPWHDLDLNLINFTNERINDSSVDSMGRLWFGTFCPKFTPGVGSLYRLDPDLSLHRMDSGFSMSNGIAWSPDASAMYFVDTYEYCIWRYDFDSVIGTIASRELFIDYRGLPWRPDGCCVDRDGNLWVAEVNAARVAAYTPDGPPRREPTKTVMLPITKPTSIAFGGPDLKTMFITTEWRGIDAEERLRQPLAGANFVVRGVAEGLSQKMFAG